MVLARLLSRHKIDMATIEARYHAEVQAGKAMLGVVPNAYPYMEIWPVGFSTYNVLIPNLVDFPQILWGLARASRQHVGLMMYTASRAAGCMYCSAHSCTFALRRGATSAQVLAATEGGDALDGASQAVVDVAEALGRMPSNLTDRERSALRARLAPDVVEWLVLVAGMMGFLNKVMDALGVELEQAVVDEVSSLVQATGWSPGKHVVEGPSGRPAAPAHDSLAVKLSVVRHIPAAWMGDRRRTRGAPSSWPGAGEFLAARTGYRFPTLGHLKQPRPLRAITAALGMNLAAENSILGLRAKHLAGLVFARHAGWDEMTRGSRAMLARLDGGSNVASPSRAEPGAVEEAVHTFAGQATDFESHESLGEAERTLARGARDDRSGWLTETEIHALMLAKAAASSPASITPLVIDRHAAQLPAPAIVELLVWLGMLQLLYRIDRFYR